MEHELECSICMQLLLDPVVASCGHDFCRGCLLAWADTLGDGRPVACPLCRSELAPSAEAVKTLGVCVRLKRMLDSLYPEKIAQRRRERQVQEEARLAKSQKSAAHQQLLHFRQGRARYLRARRTRHISAAMASGGLLLTAADVASAGTASGYGASTSAAAAGGGAGPSSHQRSVLLAPVVGAGGVFGVRQVRLNAIHEAAPSAAVVAVGGSVLPWAPHLHGAHPTLVPVGSGGGAAHAGHGVAPTAAAAGAGSSSAGGTWQAPSTVTFTMGWWEARSKKSEKRRRQQQRLSLMVMQQQAQGRGHGHPMAAVPVAN